MGEGPGRPRARGERGAGGGAEAICQLVVDDLSGVTLRVEGVEGKHLVRSLRAGPGERCWATDGRGTRAWLEILEADKAGASVRVVERERVEAPARRWWLATAAADARFDWIVEKAAELGAWGVVALDRDGRGVRRVERWGRLARAALGQCLGAWMLQVAAPVSVERLLEGVPPGGAAWAGVCVADAEGAPAGALEPASLPEGDLLLLVGPPEGFGARDSEVLADRAGLLRLRLGRLRLRSETAALAALVWARLREDRP